MQEEKQQTYLQTTTFLKTLFITDPYIKKIIQGYFEQLFESKTFGDFTMLFTKLKNAYYINENISFEERFQTYKHLLKMESSEEIKLLFNLMDTTVKDCILSFLKDCVSIVGELFSDCLDKLNDEEFLKSIFRSEINRIKMIQNNKSELNNLLNPLYNEEYEYFKQMKIEIYEKIPSVSSDCLVEIIECIDKNKFKKIDLNDFEFDLNSLNKNECEKIKNILIKYNYYC